MKRFLLNLVLVGLTSTTIAQNVIRGAVLDSITFGPVKNANVVIENSNHGTNSDERGYFDLNVGKLPCILKITCLGYESKRLILTRNTPQVVELHLKPRSINLKEVNVIQKRINYVYSDIAYTILDYKLSNQLVFILLKRSAARSAELLVKSFNGDTVMLAKLPEFPADSLYKDVVGNIYYVPRKEKIYLCNLTNTADSMRFSEKGSISDFRNVFAPLKFRLSNRIYFIENSTNYFALGYFSKNGQRNYIKKYLDFQSLKKNYDDQMFYSHWNGFINMSCQDFGKGMLVDGSEQIAQKKLFYKNSFPIFLIDSTSIAFFNFNEGRIEFLDPDGKLKKTVVLSIHDLKSNNMADTLDPSWWGWKWDWQIIQDQKNLNIYTTFHQGNRTRIQKIDLKTGCLTKFFELQYPFPKNIQIYNGEVFFLSREPGLEDRWKLISYAF